jgi:hypothetical protein
MINKDKERIKDLEWEKGSLELRLKERTDTAYTYLALFLFLMVIFVIFTIQSRNLNEENTLLKSQITTWDLKIHCSSIIETSMPLSGTADFDLQFKDYETYKYAKDGILKSLKESDEFLNCEVVK